MMDEGWVQVEKTANDEKGNRYALIGGEWKPMSKTAKDERGNRYGLPVADHIGDANKKGGPGYQPTDILKDLGIGMNDAMGMPMDVLSGMGRVAGASAAFPEQTFASEAETQGGTVPMPQQEDIPGTSAAFLKTAKSLGFEEPPTPESSVGRIAQKMLRAAPSAVWGGETKIPALLKEMGMFGLSGGMEETAKQAGAGTGMQMAAGMTPFSAAGVGQSALAAEKGLLSTVRPERANLVQKAIDAGFDIPPHMLSDSNIIKSGGNLAEHVPLSGSPSEKRIETFTKKVAEGIGVKADSVTSNTLNNSIQTYGPTIGRIASSQEIPLSADIQDMLLKHMASADAHGGTTPGIDKVINSYVDALLKSAEQNNGVIPGKSWREWNTELQGQIRRTTGPASGDVRYRLSELQKDMMDVVRSNIPVKDLKEFDEARRYYANAMMIESLVAKSPEGMISPASLMNAVTSTGYSKRMKARGKGGDLAELADIGQLIKEPRSAGSYDAKMAADAMKMGGAALTGGAVASGGHASGAGVALAGLWVTANLYNRLAPKLTKTIVGRKMLQQMEAQMPVRERLKIVPAAAQSERNIDETESK